MNAAPVAVPLLALLALLAPLAACAASGPKEARLDGKRVRYEDLGAGDEVLVLVHGWAADGSSFDPLLPELRDELRLLVVDLPGHGWSDLPDEPLSMDLFARAVAAAMDDAGVERAALLGHSNGTPVVRQFHRLWPERVRALVLVDGALRPVVPPEMAERFVELYRAPGYAERAESLADQMLASFPERLKPALREVMLATPPEVLAGGIEAATDPAAWTEEPIEAPTLCVLAAQPTWTEEYLDFVRDLVPGVELHVWEDASHYLHVEHPERFARLLLDFLLDVLDAAGPRSGDPSETAATVRPFLVGSRVASAEVHGTLFVPDADRGVA